MKVIVIGLGSMGKRRIRLIQKFDSSIEIVGVDNNEIKRNEVVQLFGISTYSDIETAFIENIFSSAFICTSPLQHSKLTTRCLLEGLNVFSEINLVSDGYTENIEIAEKNNLKLFLSSTFLFRKEIQYIGEKVKGQSKNTNYSYHVGQYLPDWHPWEAINDYFVSDTKTNGCREIFTIELPWIIETFGGIKNINVIKNKMSSLNIDYPDSYHLIIEHETGNMGTLSVDVISRKAVRNLEIFSEDLYLSWNGSANGLSEYNTDTGVEDHIEFYDSYEQLEAYNKSVVEDAYYAEIKEFFLAVAGNSNYDYSFEKDKKILDWIDVIES